MLPGFGGGPNQSILMALEAALGALGVSALRGSIGRGRPSPGLTEEVARARALADSPPVPEAFVGRSFGGRVLARLALERVPRALVLLGYPLRSASGRRRREDEEVLALLGCPTLIVQGSADPLGPLRALRRLAGKNPRLELHVVRREAHAFGTQQGEAVSMAAAWLAERLR